MAKSAGFGNTGVARKAHYGSDPVPPVSPQPKPADGEQRGLALSAGRASAKRREAACQSTSTLTSMVGAAGVRTWTL